jgi:DNA-binding NarL/FixJ family response regulator
VTEYFGGKFPMPISVLFADDHALFRQGLAALLKTVEGVTLLAQAANGREAWDLIERQQPDVAILDIGMPELTGIEVARKTSLAGLATQVVLLTDHEDPAVAIEAKKAGVAGYVLKNSSFEDLVIAVQIVAAGGTFITPVIGIKLRELQRQGRTTTVLSPREREVIRLIALGKTGKEIARLMDISPRTVDTYRERLMNKLQAHTVADVVRYAVQVGMVSMAA